MLVGTLTTEQEINELITRSIEELEILKKDVAKKIEKASNRHDWVAYEREFRNLCLTNIALYQRKERDKYDI